MKKTTSYFEDDAYSKMEEMSKNEKRSFNQILNMVVEKGLTGNQAVDNTSNVIKVPEDIMKEIGEFAEADKRTVEQMGVILMQQAIKEKKRLREKYLKSLKNNTNL